MCCFRSLFVSAGLTPLAPRLTRGWPFHGAFIAPLAYLWPFWERVTRPGIDDVPRQVHNLFSHLEYVLSCIRWISLELFLVSYGTACALIFLAALHATSRFSINRIVSAAIEDKDHGCHWEELLLLPFSLSLSLSLSLRLARHRLDFSIIDNLVPKLQGESNSPVTITYPISTSHKPSGNACWLLRSP